MAQSNHERVGKALELLNKGLKPFIEREMQSRYGTRWQYEAVKSLREQHLAGNDHAMHFRRPVVDAKRPRVAIEALQDQVARDAQGAAHLDRPVDDAAHRLGDEHLAHRRFLPRLVAALQQPRRL